MPADVMRAEAMRTGVMEDGARAGDVGFGASYPAVMRGLGMLYAVVTVVAFGFPERVVASLNATAALTGWGSALPASTEHFWLVPATSMMATSAVLFFLAARAPEVRGYAQALLVSKLVPLAAFSYLFLRERAFAYLGGMGADAVLAGVLVFYLRGTGRKLR